LIGVAVGAFSFAVYAATAARFVYWGDSAEFVAVARTLGVAHPPGYPLYTLLSALAIRVPIGTAAFRLSLLSALAGGAAAATVALFVWVLSGRLPGRASPQLPRPARVVGALGGGLAFTFASTPWSQATVPEVYSLSTFLVFSVLLLAVKWACGESRSDGAGAPRRPERGLGARALPLAALLLGLALAHHLTAFLVIPSVAVALWWGRRRRPRASAVVGSIALLACGLALYGYLPLRSAQDPAILWAKIDSWPAFLEHVSGGQYAARLLSRSPSLVFLELRRFIVGLPSGFSWAFLGAGALGFLTLWRRSPVLFAILALEIALVIAHAVNYRIPDIAGYYTPVYGLLAAAAGLGVAVLVAPGRRRGAAALVCSVAFSLLVAGALFLEAWSSWPERNLSNQRGAALFAEELLDSAEAGMVLAQNDRTVFLLWHACFVEGKRPDLAIIDVRGRAPHFEKWFPWVTFPTEGELARHFGWSEDRVCDPPAREALSVGAYLPLLVALNQDSLAVYADVDLARSAFPERALPSGLLARVTPDSVASIPRDLVKSAIALGRARGRGADRQTAQAYAKVVGDYGELFLVRGKTESAIRALERSTKLAPDIPEFRSNLGVAYLSAGRLEDGVREVRAALELDPGLAAAHHVLYGLFVGAGEIGRATAALEAAVRFDRANTRYRLELAALYERSGDHTEAETVYRTLERTDPSSSAVRLAYGDFLVRRRRFSDAVAAYSLADELSPGSPGILCNLGRCYWELSETDRAIEAMRRSVELQPHNPRLKYELAHMLHLAGRSEEALVHLDDVIRILPGMWEARALKATILGEGGRYPEARRLFEEAGELGADDPSFWGAWSEMESAAGDSARASELQRRLE
jgi:Flp pilus assembly protein TadD